MEIIQERSGSGRTIALISRAERDNSTIIVASLSELERVKAIALMMGVSIPDPVLWMRLSNGDLSRTRFPNGFLIENADLILQSLFNNGRIKTASFNEPMESEYDPIFESIKE